MFTFKTAIVRGNIQGKTCWAQAICEDKLYILLEVETGEDTPEIAGEKLLDQIQKALYLHPPTSLAILDKLLTQCKEKTEITTLIIGSLHENILYLGAVGKAMVLLKRDKNIATLLLGESSISGYIHPHDVLFSSTKEFLGIIPNSLQKELLHKASIEDIAKSASPLILSAEDSSGCLALVSEIEQLSPSPLPIEQSSFRSDAPLAQRHSFKSLFSKFNISRLLKEESVIPEDEKTIKSKRMLATIAAILILLLIASIFFGFNTSVNRVKNADFTKNTDLVSHEINEAQSLIDLNPARARDLLSSAKSTLISLQKQFDKGSKEYHQIDDLLQKVNQTTETASRVYKLSTVPVFFDITLLKASGTGTKLAFYQGKMTILDTQNKAAYMLTSETKQSDIVAGERTVKESKVIGIHGSTIYLLNTDGIVALNITSKSSQVVIKKDDVWGDISDLVAFAGNIYLLDRGKNQIWKYIATESGFTPRQSYLDNDVKADFSQYISMSIDGSIWVGGRNTIGKFTQGRPDQFTIQNVVGDITSVSAIFTDDNSKNIYILDKNAEKIFVLDKTGIYQEAFQWSGLKSASSFIVSEDQKKIFILSGSKIYAIELK